MFPIPATHTVALLLTTKTPAAEGATNPAPNQNGGADAEPFPIKSISPAVKFSAAL